MLFTLFKSKIFMFSVFFFKFSWRIQSRTWQYGSGDLEINVVLHRENLSVFNLLILP